jgi:isoquinoline 1-oxidoreductase subunit alpha
LQNYFGTQSGEHFLIKEFRFKKPLLRILLLPISVGRTTIGRVLQHGVIPGCMCGSCTVHVDGQAVRSCSVSVGSVEGKLITTIEGLDSSNAHPVQQAWIEYQVPQCGYCQSGQIMQAAALLGKNSHPTEQQIVDGMTGNMCRCATYSRIVCAVKRAAEIMNDGGRHA